MSQKYTQDGVELVVAGLREFQNNLKQAGVSWDDTVKRFRASSGQIAKTTDIGPAFAEMRSQLSGAIPMLDQFGQGLGAAGAAAGGMTVATGGLSLALGGALLAVQAAGVAFRVIASAIREAFQAMKQVGTRALMLAGEFQEMELATLAIGRAMGKSRSEIESNVQEMVDLGIRVDAANKVVAQFTRYQLDLASAVDLVRIAQATGIMMHRDSTEEMESLVHAALSGSTIMLRQRGIFIDATRAAKDYATELGRDVETLTEAEKAQGRLNAIIKSGANVLGVYDAAMKSPTKQLRTLTGREIPTLLAQMGAPFLDAFSTAVGAVRGVVKTLMEATREGGSLYPILINLGAAASLLADGFAIATEKISKWIRNFDLSVTKGLTGVIEKMFTFGFELIAMFAEGIVTATTTVLVAALKAVSWMLSFWIAPGSPPKIAPGITQWGIDTMAEYLRGFTMADFSILETIQDPLSRILQGPEFSQFSQELIAAMAGGKELTTAFYDRIAEAAGKFGEEVAELAKRRVELALATDAATAAEERLERAEKRALQTQEQVGIERRKYNEMLREGASEAQLAAQMLEIRGAEERARLAREELKTSKVASEAAKDRKDVAKEEYDLQAKLVDQLLKLDKAQRDIEKEKEAAAKKPKKGEPLIPGMEMPEPAGWDITSRISEAIDRAKAALKEKLKELFKPLTDAWAEIQKQLGKLSDTWSQFKIDVGKAWEGLKEKYPILQAIEDWVKNLPTSLSELKLAWSEFKTDVLGYWAEIKEQYPIFEEIEDWFKRMPDHISYVSSFLTGIFANSIRGIVRLLVIGGEGVALSWALGIIDDFFKNILPDAIQVFIDGALLQLAIGLDNAAKAARGLKSALEELGGVKNALATVGVGLIPFLGKSPSPLEKGLTGVNRALRELDANLFTRMSSISTALGGTRLYREPRMAAAAPAGSTTTQQITLDFGDVYISDREEGDRFQGRVENAVLAALKVG